MTSVASVRDALWTDGMLERLNSATKYPSIPTLHKMDERGRLLDELQVVFEPGDDVIVTEKIDGTNARIVMWGDMWLIGSRNEFLTARNDVVANPAQGIVSGLRESARRIHQYIQQYCNTGEIVVVYGEFYGKGVQQWKNYTKNGWVGFLTFDTRSLDASLLETMDRPQLSTWREGSDGWWDTDPSGETNMVGAVPVSPDAGAPPSGLRDTLAWMEHLGAETRAGLDGVPGKCEGYVIRTPDRSKIAKVRFQDYRRAVK